MAILEYTDIEGQVQRVELQNSTLIIGRSPSCHIVLRSLSVGRNHGRIDPKDDKYYYTDLGSVNGSFINGQKVTGSVLLNDGDALRLGDVTLRFHAARPSGLYKTQNVVGTSVQDDQRRSATDSVALVELARLRKENAALKAELKAASGKAGPEVGNLRKQLEEARAALAAAEEEVRHLRGLVADNERRVKDAESRASMSASSLESIHAKYMEMREQVRHLKEQLDIAREEASDREVEAADLRQKLAAAEAQIETLRNKSGQVFEDIASLKVKLTERDREIERLRREVDLREYDLKSLREENERLAEYCQADTGRQNQLERKVRNLEAVIEDNRNIIAELRRSLEEREREIREIRLGIGIADLEQERQRLLDDFHKKSRELDEARATIKLQAVELANAQTEREALETRIRQLEEAARIRRSEREDISDHPQFKALQREKVASDELISQLKLELERALREGFPAEERAYLVAELAAANEKAKALGVRVEELQARLKEQAVVKDNSLEVRSFIGRYSETVESLSDGLTVMSSVIRDILNFLTALARSDMPLQPDVAEKLEGATLMEMTEALRDTMRLVTAETDRLKTMWHEGMKLLEEG